MKTSEDFRRAMGKADVGFERMVRRSLMQLRRGMGSRPLCRRHSLRSLRMRVTAVIVARR